MKASTTPVTVGGPSRRSVVRSAAHGAAAAAISLAVSGCGLRLDLPAPPPPVPTRRRAADEALLISVVRDLRQIVRIDKALLTRTGGGDQRMLAALLALHTEQVKVLTGRLTNVGVPIAAIDAAGIPEPKDASVKSLASRLGSLEPSRWEALAASTVATRDVLVSAYSARLAGAALLDDAVAMPASPSPVRESIVARTRPLVYAFEVVAAQSGGDQRRSASSTLRGLKALESEVSVGSTSAPTGWALPFPVTTSGSARRLASHTLSAAITSLADVVGPTPRATSLRDAAIWSSRVQSLATGWSLPLVPFPATGR